MNTWNGILGGLLLTTLGCSSTEVQTEFGPAAFDGFGQSYDWLPFAAVAGSRGVGDEALDTFVHGVINRELTRKGYTLNAHARDFVVTYQVGTTKVEVPYWDPQREGLLIINALHPKTNQLMWRGAALAEIEPSTPPSERREIIDEAITAIFEEFPRQGAP